MITKKYSCDVLKDMTRLVADCRAAGVLLSKESEGEVPNGSISGPVGGEYVVTVDTPENAAIVDAQVAAQ